MLKIGHQVSLLRPGYWPRLTRHLPSDAGDVKHERFTLFALTALCELAHEHHIPDLLYLGENHSVGIVLRERARVHESGRVRLADKEWGNDKLYLVGKILRKKLCVDLPSAFDHQSADSALSKVVENRPEIQRAR